MLLKYTIKNRAWLITSSSRMSMFNLKYAIMATFICLFLLSSCDTSDKFSSDNIQGIIFQPAINNEALNCNSIFAHSNKKWQYTQLQFFISAVELKNNKGVWQKMSLRKSAFQTNNSVLLGEQCNLSNEQNKANWQLTFDKKIELKNISHIRFDLGLPFAVNHLNPLTQESPLNIPSMFWAWQIGHKFLRLEMAANNDNWLFHLGSTGCKSASPLRSPKEECRYPNRYTYELPISKKNNKITLDLSILLHGLIITEQTSCQSSPNKSSCQTLFSNLNIKNDHGVFQTINEDTHHE